MGTGLFDVIGSVPDIVGALATVADQMKAQEGLAYNLYTFRIPRPPSSGESPPSAPATRKQSIVPVMGVTWEDVPILSLSAPSALPVTSRLELSFCLRLFRRQKESVHEVGAVALHYADGFDSAIGDQAGVEFGGVDLDEHGHIVGFKGFVNPMGRGHVDFSGAVIVTSTEVAGLRCGLPRTGKSVGWLKRSGYSIAA
jgi:hypothetical protein